MPAFKYLPVVLFVPTRVIVADPSQTMLPLIAASFRVMLAPSGMITVCFIEPVSTSPSALLCTTSAVTVTSAAGIVNVYWMSVIAVSSTAPLFTFNVEASIKSLT